MAVRRLLGPTLAALALAPAACGGSGEKPARETPRATATQRAGVDPDTGCRPRRPAGAEVPLPDPPKGRLDPSKAWTARVTTNCGTFEIALAVKRAPQTTASFASLARQNFYDGLTFHRIVPGFVIQGGDPKGDGTGDPGYKVTEPPPSTLAYKRGVVAMAKGEADPAGRSGSQFFVVTGADAQLPPQYALLGRVSQGQAVVDAIGVVPTTAEDRPRSPVVIESIRILER